MCLLFVFFMPLFSYFAFASELMFNPAKLFGSGINSTESRQRLADINESRVFDEAVHCLRQESASGVMESVKAYSLYVDLLAGRKSEFFNDPACRERLLRCGVCFMDNGVFKMQEFQLSDELPCLLKTKRFLREKDEKKTGQS